MKNKKQGPVLGPYFSNGYAVRAFSYWDDESCQTCCEALQKIRLNVELVNLPEDNQLAINWNHMENFLAGEVLVNDLNGNVMIMDEETFRKMFWTVPGLEHLGLGNFWSFYHNTDDRPPVKSFPIIMNEQYLDAQVKDWTEKREVMVQLASLEFYGGHIQKGLFIQTDDWTDFQFDVQWVQKGRSRKVFYFFIKVHRYAKSSSTLIEERAAARTEAGDWAKIWD